MSVQQVRGGSGYPLPKAQPLKRGCLCIFIIDSFRDSPPFFSLSFLWYFPFNLIPIQWETLHNLGSPTVSKCFIYHLINAYPLSQKLKTKYGKNWLLYRRRASWSFIKGYWKILWEIQTYVVTHNLIKRHSICREFINNYLKVCIMKFVDEALFLFERIFLVLSIFIS